MHILMWGYHKQTVLFLFSNGACIKDVASPRLAVTETQDFVFEDAALHDIYYAAAIPRKMPDTPTLTNLWRDFGRATRGRPLRL
jgi:hypothetical protein